MRTARKTALVIIFSVSVSSCGLPKRATLPPVTAKIKGMTEAGYTPIVFNSSAVQGSITRLHRDGVTWLSIQVAWYQDNNASTRIFASATKTPTDSSVTHLIHLAHHAGMRVFLNPFVNSLQGSGWQALFHPTSPKLWFKSYDEYVSHYAQLAEQDHVDLFGIGDEFDSLDTVPQYRPDWIHAIAVARRFYHGPVTYGADYTNYARVTFWGPITDVGVDAYFPLSTSPNPTVPDLTRQWNRIANRIEAWRQKSHLASKPFLITELGYPSETGAALTPGSWSPRQPVNLTLQKHLYQATFESIWRRPWLFGIMWFWWANPSNPNWRGGSQDNGYTPRNKPAEIVLKQYFGHP